MITVALVMKHTNSCQRSQGNAVVHSSHTRTHPHTDMHARTHAHAHAHTHTNVHMKVISRNQAKAGAYVPSLKIEKYLKDHSTISTLVMSTDIYTPESLHRIKKLQCVRITAMHVCVDMLHKRQALYY